MRILSPSSLVVLFFAVLAGKCGLVHILFWYCAVRHFTGSITKRRVALKALKVIFIYALSSVPWRPTTPDEKTMSPACTINMLCSQDEFKSVGSNDMCIIFLRSLWFASEVYSDKFLYK